MILDWFRGITKKDDLVPDKYNGDWKRLVNWWNDHDLGVRAWDNVILNVHNVSSSYSILTSDTFLFIDATNTLTLTLPTAVGAQGKSYTFIVTAGNKTVTITTTSGQTINGATNAYLPTQYTSMRIVSDGSNWFMY